MLGNNYSKYSLNCGASLFSADAMDHEDVSATVALATEDHGADMTPGGPYMYRHVMVQRVTMLETLPTDVTPMNQWFSFFLEGGPKVVWQRQ